MLQTLLARVARGERVRLLGKALNGKVTMGYYIRIDDVDWEIKETPESLSTIREMPTKYDGIKRGGSSSGERWFSWMNDTEIESAESVESVFNQLGFETESTEGGFKLLGYDSKTGQEDLFLAVMAPFTVSGSYIEWVGEDNSQWKYVISEGRMYTQDCTITWTNAKPYGYYHIDYVRGEPKQMTLDPLAQNVDEQLQIAKQWHEDNQKYLEERRAEHAKNESISLA